MFSTRSTKFRSYSARIIKNYDIKGINEVIAQEVLLIGTIAQEVLDNYYLSVRPLVLSSNLSHMWDRLNLPLLLFKEGLLTLM